MAGPIAKRAGPVRPQDQDALGEQPFAQPHAVERGAARVLGRLRGGVGVAEDKKGRFRSFARVLNDKRWRERATARRARSG